MSTERHGADCFAILSFVQGFGSNKVYNVRHKETGEHLTMHVIAKKDHQVGALDTLLHTKTFRIPFLISLRYTFQTRSRSYLVLDSIENERQLSKFYNSFGPFYLQEVVFLAAEIITAISHLHVCCTSYRQLNLENVLIDATGHVKLKRDIFDSSQWAQLECFLCQGRNLCPNHAVVKVEQSAVAKDWEDIGNLVCLLLTGKRAFKEEDWNKGRQSTYKTGLFRPYSLPTTLPDVAADFIEGLLQWKSNPLPTSLTQSHKLFASIDWQKVAKRQLTPPDRFISGISKSPNTSATQPEPESILFKNSSSSAIPSHSHNQNISDDLKDANAKKRYRGLVEDACNPLLDSNETNSRLLASVDLEKQSHCIPTAGSKNSDHLSNSNYNHYTKGYFFDQTNAKDSPVGDVELSSGQRTRNDYIDAAIKRKDTETNEERSSFLEPHSSSPFLRNNSIDECPDDVIFVTAESLDDAWRRSSSKSTARTHDGKLKIPENDLYNNHRKSTSFIESVNDFDLSSKNFGLETDENIAMGSRHQGKFQNRDISCPRELCSILNKTAFSPDPLNTMRSLSYYDDDCELLSNKKPSHGSQISTEIVSEIDDIDYDRMRKFRSSSLDDPNNLIRNYGDLETFSHAEIFEQQNEKSLLSRPKLEGSSTTLMPGFVRSHSYHGGFVKSKDNYSSQIGNPYKLSTLERANKLLESNFGDWRERLAGSMNSELETSEQFIKTSSTEDIRASVVRAKSLHKRLSQSLQKIRARDSTTSRIPLSVGPQNTSVSHKLKEASSMKPFSFSAESNEDISSYMNECLNSTWPANEQCEEECDTLKKTWPIFVSGANVESRFNKKIENDKRNFSLMQKISDGNALQKIKQGAYLQGQRNFNIPSGSKASREGREQVFKINTIFGDSRDLVSSANILEEDHIVKNLSNDECENMPKGRANQYLESSKERSKSLFRQDAISASVPETVENNSSSYQEPILLQKFSNSSSDSMFNIGSSGSNTPMFNFSSHSVSSVEKQKHNEQNRKANSNSNIPHPSFARRLDKDSTISLTRSQNDKNDANANDFVTRPKQIIEENIEALHKDGDVFQTPDNSFDLEFYSDDNNNQINFKNNQSCSTESKFQTSSSTNETTSVNGVTEPLKTPKTVEKSIKTSNIAQPQLLRSSRTDLRKADRGSTRELQTSESKKDSFSREKKKQRIGAIRKATSVESVLNDIQTINIDKSGLKNSSIPLSVNHSAKKSNANKIQSTDNVGTHENMVADKQPIKSGSKEVKKKRATTLTASSSERVQTANQAVPSKIPVSRKSLSTGAIAVKKQSTSTKAASDAKMKVFLSPRCHRNINKRLKETDDVKLDVNHNYNEENKISGNLNVTDSNTQSPVAAVDAVDLIDRLKVLSDGCRSGRSSPASERRFGVKEDEHLDRMNSVRRALQPSITVEVPTPDQTSLATATNLQVSNDSSKNDIVSRESSIGSASDLWLEEEEKRSVRLKRKYCRRSSSGTSGKSYDSLEEMRRANVLSPTLTLNSSEDDTSVQIKDLDRASFNSGRSIDSGLSDIFESSREDVYNTSESTSRGKAVAKSDSGVMKDIEESRMSQSDDNVFEEKQENEDNKTEDMIQCNSCHKNFVPDGVTSNSPVEIICKRCCSKKVERKEAIVELIQTEINYGQDLRILKEEFYNPIKNGGILSPENLTAVFLNLQELIDVNSKLCITLQDDLEECISKSDQELTSLDVGRVFLDNVEFFQAYEVFCAKQRQALELVESLKKKSELLRIFLQVSSKQNSKLRKMDLKSFLAMPVQRIMKYPLLLTRIYRATQRGNPDREALMSARRKIEEQIGRINEIAVGRPAKLRKCKSTSALNQTDSAGNHLKRLAAEILNWKQEETLIILSGSIEVSPTELIGLANWSRKSLRKQSPVQAILCAHGVMEHVNWSAENGLDTSETGLPAKNEVTDAAVILLRRKSSSRYALFKEPILLRQAVIAHRPDIEVAFEICPILKEPFTFLVEDQRTCENWLRNLNHLAKHQGMWRKRRNAMANIMIKSMS